MPAAHGKLPSPLYQGTPPATPWGMTSPTADHAAGPGAPVPFAITGPAQLVLGADRTGTTTFTVTNLTGRPLTVRMEPKAAPPGQDGWYVPVGESEVPMGVGATLTVEVQATVPADAPEGSTTMKLRAVDEAEPERLTDGPAVEVVVPAPPPPPRKIPWIPILAAVVALLAIGGAAVWWFFLRPTLPVNTEPPVVPATALVGAQLEGDPGVWEDEPDLALQWLRCDGDDCTPIEGATDGIYLVVLDDASKQLALQVTATNEDGSTVVPSNRTQVAQAPPVAATDPSLTGTPEAGQTLTLDPGVWTDADEVTQQWMDCAPGDDATCTAVPGATGTTLALNDALTGRLVYADVTATNPGGFTVVPTNKLGPVGVAQVSVPKVTDITLAEAQTQLDQVGLVPEVLGPQSWCSTVTAQNPAAFQRVDAGTPIRLTISYQPLCLFWLDLLPVEQIERVNPRYMPPDFRVNP